MKRFFYASAAILMLSLALHFGYSTARAQAPGNPVVATFGAGTPAVVTANGDVYVNDSGSPGGSLWRRAFNVFTNAGPTPTQHESWGSLKARYAPQSAPVLQTPTNK